MCVIYCLKCWSNRENAPLERQRICMEPRTRAGEHEHASSAQRSRWHQRSHFLFALLWHCCWLLLVTGKPHLIVRKWIRQSREMEICESGVWEAAHLLITTMLVKSICREVLLYSFQMSLFASRLSQKRFIFYPLNLSKFKISEKNDAKSWIFDTEHAWQTDHDIE